MMTVAFLPLELRSLDKLRADVLVLSLFEDERPLRGVGGLVDWRTAGMLSRFLTRGYVTGKTGEIVLFPPGPKTGVPTGLCLGLGEAARFDQRRYESVVEEAAVHLRKMKGKRVALALPGAQLASRGPSGALVPGAPSTPVSIENAVDALVDATMDDLTQLTLLSTPDERKAITEALKRRRGELDVVVGPVQPGPRNERQGGNE